MATATPIEYQVIDTRTQTVVRTIEVKACWRKASRSAYNVAERRNQEYGAHRFTTKPVYQ